MSLVRGPMYVLDSIALATAFRTCTDGNYLLSRTSVPPSHAEEPDEGCHTDSVVHVGSCYRLHRWEEQNNTDEADPCHCYSVHRFAPFSHREGTRVELHAAFVTSVCNDDRNVTDVKRGSGDVEDGNDCQGAADANEIETAAESNNEPDGVDGRVRDRVDLAPESAVC